LVEHSKDISAEAQTHLRPYEKLSNSALTWLHVHCIDFRGVFVCYCSKSVVKSIPSTRSELPEKKDRPSSQRPSTEEIFEVIEGKRDRLITLLKDLIRIPTVVPPGDNYEDIVQYLEPLFRKLNFSTERVVVPPEHIEKIPLPLKGPRINLVANRDHEKGQSVTLYAHMDVVPIEEAWTKDPFDPIVENGKLYGRGAVDMKCGIAGILVALEVIDELGLEPHFDITCTFCTDEEVIVYPGIYHLAKEGHVKGHVINTELGAQNPLIIDGIAGAVDVTIRTKGRSCHSGMNFMGVNAVEAMIPILTELLTLKAEVEQRESAIPIVPLLKAFGAPSDFVTPMFNMDIIKGGVKSNIVPAECELVINRRYVPEEPYEQVVKEIQDAVERGKAQSKALDVEVSFLHLAPPFKADTTSEFAVKMREALKAVHGYQDAEFIIGGAAASTDMGFILLGSNIEHIIGIGAATVDNLSAHKSDEWVSIDSLVNMTKQLVHYLAL
jgi:succinyl-diaminopimelate desuccinylase